LHAFSSEDAHKVREQLTELEKDALVKGWINGDDATRKVLENVGKDKINLYRDLKGQATEAKVSVETENQLYNHLTLFFSRYLR